MINHSQTIANCCTAILKIAEKLMHKKIDKVHCETQYSILKTERIWTSVDSTPKLRDVIEENRLTAGIF